MRIVKARFENGQVRLTESPPEAGPADVEVVFLGPDDQRWEEILNDPSPRPALEKAAQDALAEEAADKTENLRI